MRECGLQTVGVYIRRRRGALRQYFETYKPELLKEVTSIRAPARAQNKILWWRQPWIEKKGRKGEWS
jgi:hypothetical protein